MILIAVALVALSAEFYLSQTGARYDLAVEQAAFADYHARAGKTQRGRNPDTRQAFPIVFNQFGLYDATARHEAPAPDRFPILLLGDSFVENLSLPFADGLAAQLEKSLRATNPNADVIQAGLGGIGTDREFDMLREVAPTMKPRLVLLGWFNNDLWDISPDRGPAAKQPRLLQRSYLYQFLLDRLARTADSADQRLKYRLAYESFFAGGEKDALITNALNRTFELLGQMDEYCREHGMRFGVVAIPNSVSFSEITTKGAYAEIAGSLGRSLRGFRPGQPYYLIAQMAIAENIAVYPYLYVVFKKALSARPPQTEQARRLLYFVNDPHWNENGCKIAADAVAEWLRTSGLVRN